MSTRILTVARLVKDEINGIEIEGDAFGKLLDSLGIMPKIEQRGIVTSAKPGDDDTRAYIVDKHTVPGIDGTTQVYACTCPDFKFHQVHEHRDEIHDDPEAGFESLDQCKHGDAVAFEDRTADDRDTDQQGFGAFSGSNAQDD
ncbi:hypothetical protein MUK72_17915 (plasmid) [Halococcus dombrowskii]|uniref:SWIM-type domain-containing protein n=1 Tax=Halococcus dombrowskii TaxID=179637 RepID=A0AAV3SFZ9_HALDO|nr:hypothetical protein [Halococcus dombrowskii]UOO97144.1 hypothetical protein MUK72_17915 [Halococcus dombrowskii]